MNREEEFENIIVNTKGFTWKDRYDALAFFALRIAKELDEIMKMEASR